MADWKKTASTSTSAYAIGTGLLVTAGVLAANPGVGLGIDGGGFLVVNPGQGLGIAGSQVIVPGGAITNALLAALSVGTSQLQDNSVTGTQIAAASITTAHIGAAQITTALIANAQITNVLLGTAVVGTANIEDAAITTAKCGSLDASVITTGTLGVALSVAGGGFSTVVNSAGVLLTETGTSLNTQLGAGVMTMIDPSNSTHAVIASESGSASFAFFVFGASCTISGQSSSAGSQMTVLNTSAAIIFSVNATTGTIGSVPSNTASVANLLVTGLIRFGGTNSTGSGAALLGANCPAGGSLTAPNTWIEVTNAAGGMGWIPMWI